MLPMTARKLQSWRRGMNRKTLYLMLLVISLSACSSNVQNTPPEPTKSPEEVNKALSGLIEERDEFGEFSVYYAQTTIDNIDKNDFYVYFIKNEEGIVSNLHYVVDYIGNREIDTKWIKIRADEEVFEVTNNAGILIKKSFSYSTVREVYEDTVYLKDLKMIKAMANAEKTIVRLTGLGLYQEDIVLSNRQKQAMLNVLRAYKNAGGENKFYGNEL